MIKEHIKKITKRSLPIEVKLAAKSGQDKKGEGICVLDLRDLSAFTDFFVILNGNSSRQNLALFEGMVSLIKKGNILLEIKGTAMIDHIIGWSLPVSEEIEITEHEIAEVILKKIRGKQGS